MAYPENQPNQQEAPFYIRNKASLLSGTTDAESAFNTIAEKFNSGLSSPHASLDSLTTHLFPSLVALVLAGRVEDERKSGQIGPFTQFERKILNNWGKNEEKRLKDIPESTPISKALEIVEFLGAQRFLEETIQKMVSRVTNIAGIHSGENLKLGIFDNFVAALIAREFPKFLHSNSLDIENNVVLNAAGYDPEGLLAMLDNVTTNIQPHTETI